MKQKIRVMHLMLSMEVGGMENGVANILRNTRDSLDNYLCCLEKIGTLGGMLDGSAVSIVNMSKKPGFSIPLIYKLSRLLIRNKIDILHSRCWSTLVYGYAASRIAGTPGLVHSEHGVFNLDYERRRKLYSYIVKRADRLLTVSSSLKDRIEEIVNQTDLRIKTIVNGVDTEKYRPAPNRDYGKQFGLKEKDVIIGSVGRLEKVKNYELFIETISRIKDKSVKGVLVGDGPERSNLENMARALNMQDRFIFLGKREDVSEIMPLFDIYVCSSHSEGLSNTILEAMASGVPSVATRVGGNPEIVCEGETGFLVKPGDAEIMTASIMDLIADNDMLSMMKLKARDAAVKQYSLSRMVSEYEEVYKSVYELKTGRSA